MSPDSQLLNPQERKALKNVTVISHKFLVPYRGMALMHGVGPRRDGLQACD